MAVVNEEIFGPVAPIFLFDTEDEVIAASNACDAGLVSYIFTQDVTRANRVSELLQFGIVAVNTGVVSDAASPYVSLPSAPEQVIFCPFPFCSKLKLFDLF